jgi:hypothetical protein
MRNRVPVIGMAAAVTISRGRAVATSLYRTQPSSDRLTYKATLTGRRRAPDACRVRVALAASRACPIPTTGLMAYTVTYSGLGSASTASHIHCCGTDAQAVGVLVNFQTFGNVLFTPGPTSQTYKRCDTPHTGRSRRARTI